MWQIAKIAFVWAAALRISFAMLPGVAFADQNVAWMVDEIKGTNEVAAYLQISFQTLVWANASLARSGKPQLFCAPPTRAVLPEEVEGIFRKYVRTHPSVQQLPWAQFPAALTVAMQDHFPCANK